MTKSSSSEPKAPISPENTPNNAAGGFLKVLLPIIVLAVGVVTAVILLKTGPKAEKQTRTPQARLVSVIPVNLESHSVELSCLGNVRAKQMVVLRPQVSGIIVSVAEGLVPGTVVREGDLLFQIDPTDYEIQVAARQADLNRAIATLTLEMGQQEVARQDYALTRQNLSGAELDLVLRGPQLRQAQANVEAAEAQLQAARIQLKRTSIQSPFDAVILRIPESEGTLVSTASVLTEIAGISSFWVELALPPKDVKWIQTGDNGSSIRFLDELSWGTATHRTGKVVNISPQQQAQSQTMTVIAEIEDPLNLLDENSTDPEVHLDSIIRAEISGRTLSGVVRLPRSLLQKNDIVYLATAEDTLEFRAVDVAFRGPDYVLIEGGLKDGERVITSVLASPVEGMKLRYSNQMREPVEQEIQNLPATAEKPTTQS